MKNPVSGLSTFPRLVIAFLLIVIPLFTLGLVMNRLGENSARNGWIQSKNSRTQFYANTLETEMEHITKLLAENITNKDLSHLSFLGQTMSEYDWTEAVNRLGYQMHVIKNSSIYVLNVNAYLLTVGITIPDDGSFTDDIPDDYAYIKPNKGRADAYFLVSGNRFFMARSFPEGWLEPDYALSVELNTEKLVETLKDLAGTNAHAALVGVSQHWVITDQGVSSVKKFPDMERFIQNLDRNQDRHGDTTSELNGVDEAISYQYASSLDSYLLLYRTKNDMIGGISLYRTLLWILLFASIVIIFAYSWIIYRMIHRPLQKMVRAYRRVRSGELEPVSVPKGNNEFHYLFENFNSMILRLQKLIRDNYEQEIRAKNAQLKQLQSQINPHFLYNTYYILYRLSQAGDLENVSRFSRHLGRYFEFITPQNDDAIPLEAEMNHTKTYIDIQNFRFSERIRVETTSLPDSCRQVKVPKLILQPIVENAFKYALERKKKDGRLFIQIIDKGNRVLISVEDNGDQLTDGRIADMQEELNTSPMNTNSTGIINVHRRLRLMYGDDSGLHLSRGELGGLKVTLQFAKKQHESPS